MFSREKSKALLSRKKTCVTRVSAGVTSVTLEKHAKTPRKPPHYGSNLDSAGPVRAWCVPAVVSGRLPATANGGGGQSLPRVAVLPPIAGVTSWSCQPRYMGHGETTVVIARHWWRVPMECCGASRGVVFWRPGEIPVFSAPTW
jgi:hypothetical protein